MRRPRPAIPSCRCGIPCQAQAACRPAGTCSSQEWPSHAVANDAVDRHEDEPAPPGDAAREAFLGLAAFFVVTDPPPLAAPSWPELLLSAQAASVGSGLTPVAGCSKSAAGQQQPEHVKPNRALKRLFFFGTTVSRPASQRKAQNSAKNARPVPGKNRSIVDDPQSSIVVWFD